MGVNDFGTSAQPLNNPALGDPGGWADSVAKALNGSDVTVNQRIADHESKADPHTQYQRESEKGAASGYASLGSDTKVPIAQVPTGTSGTTVALGNHLHTGVYWKLWTGTQAAYDAIGTKDANTLYVVVG